MFHVPFQCICGVYRAHILQSEKLGSTSTDEYLVFNDLESQQKASRNRLLRSAAPSLEDITAFYRDVFRRSQMETDCIIMSLIYVERLIKISDGDLRPRSNNWRSILFSCMVLASKVWDDLSMWVSVTIDLVSSCYFLGTAISSFLAPNINTERRFQPNLPRRCQVSIETNQ